MYIYTKFELYNLYNKDIKVFCEWAGATPPTHTLS